MVFCAQEEDAAIIRRFLESQEIELKEWNKSGATWINKWQALKPFIVFVDYLLPKKDGLFILRNINHYDAEQHVVFMHSYSGFAANDLELRALKTGAKGLIQKPLTETKLKNCLRHFTDK